MASPASLIFAIEGDAADGPADLVKTIKRLQSVLGAPTSISDVYEFDSRKEGRALRLVVSLAFPRPPESAERDLIEKISEAAESDDHPEVVLLAAGESFLRAGRWAVPHPELHLKPQWLVPAAEIQGSFKHPVLHQSLSDLADHFRTTQWGMFYCRGVSLLDFLVPET